MFEQRHEYIKSERSALEKVSVTGISTSEDGGRNDVTA